MLGGIATVSFFADDVEAAKHWYRDVLGIEAYFARPEPPAPSAYIEFRVGEDEVELGIIDRSYAPMMASMDGPAGAIVYWQVDDLSATLDRLTAMGATMLEPKTERGHGFVTASFVDPFGNVLGVMQNPHYAALYGRRTS